MEVGLPDLETRRAMLEMLGREGRWSEDVDYAALAQRTLGKTCADLRQVARRAALAALEAHIAGGGEAAAAPLCVSMGLLSV